MTCPRRQEVAGFPGQPGFDPSEENADTWIDDRCSWCGSLNPSRFLEQVVSDAEVGPTDKNYKVYLNNTDLGFTKFYFQHFDQTQRSMFIQLVNDNKVRYGYPGYFYVEPFFMRRADDQATS